jgi:predicted transcriptional regulator
VEDLDDALNSMGPLEARLMQAIWGGELVDFTVSDARSRVLPELAYTTVMTTLNRLARKGLLSVAQHPGQRAARYSVAGMPSDHLARLSRGHARRLREQFGDRALAAFAAELGDLSPEDLERLQRLAEG